MTILHFNDRNYQVQQYSVQKNGKTIVAQFVAEVMLPDNLKTSEVLEAIKILKISGYFFEVHCSLIDKYCYTEGTLLDTKGNEEDYLPLGYLIKPQDYEKVRAFLISQMDIIISQNKCE